MPKCSDLYLILEGVSKDRPGKKQPRSLASDVRNLYQGGNETSPHVLLSRQSPPPGHCPSHLNRLQVLLWLLRGNTCLAVRDSKQCFKE